MKNIVITLIMLLTLSACTQQKIGYVDSTELMKNYKVVKALEKEIEEKQNTLQVTYQQIALAFEKEVQEFQTKSKSMPQKKAEARYQELMFKQQQIQQSQQNESAKLQNESQEKMDEIIEDVKDFVEEYAKANSYTFILGSNDSGNVLYGDSKMELTETVLDALNKEYKDSDKSEETTEEKETEETLKEEEKK